MPKMSERQYGTSTRPCASNARFSSQGRSQTGMSKVRLFGRAEGDGSETKQSKLTHYRTVDRGFASVGAYRRAELRREPVDLSALAANRAEEVRKQWPGRQAELVIDPELKADCDYRLLGILVFYWTMCSPMPGSSRVGGSGRSSR